jgi:phage gp36-like protein
MAYCTIDDIKSLMNENRLVNLTDDTNTGAVDENFLQAVIDGQSKIIDGYLRGRYSLPINLNSQDSILKSINESMVIVHLELRRSQALSSFGEYHKNKYEKMLNEIKKGHIALDISEDTTESDVPTPVVISKKTKVFTDEMLDKMP